MVHVFRGSTRRRRRPPPRGLDAEAPAMTPAALRCRAPTFERMIAAKCPTFGRGGARSTRQGDEAEHASIEAKLSAMRR